MKLPPTTCSTSIHLGLVHVLAAPLLIQLPVNVPGTAVEHGPSTWDLAIYMRDLDEVAGFRFLPGLVLAVVVIWGMNQQLEDSAL